MILKYYTNGWNFLDVGSKCQTFNVKLSDLEMKVKAPTKEFLLSSEDQDNWNKAYEQYKHELDLEIMEKAHSLKIDGNQMMPILNLPESFYKFSFNRNSFEIKEIVYVRFALFFDEDGLYSYMVYQGTSFLQDGGKTMEVLSRDRQVGI